MPDIIEPVKSNYTEYQRNYRLKNREKRNKQSKEHYESSRKKKFIDNPQHYLWYVARARAKQFKIEFNIEVSDVVIPEFCPITNRKLVKGDGYNANSMSLDRVNNDLGYIKGNVRVISRWANMKKSSLTEELLVKLLQYIRGEI